MCQCNVEVASEYRYRDSVSDPQTLVVTLSQSGETADTLAALQHAKSLGMTRTLMHLQCAGVVAGARKRAALHYAGGSGNWRGVDQGVHHAAWRALYLLTLIFAKLRGQAARCEVEMERVAGACGICPSRSASVLALETGDQDVGRSDFAMKQDALFLGRGASLSDRASKAHSSSRKSPTSTPRPMPLENSSTARWRWSIRICR